MVLRPLACALLLSTVLLSAAACGSKQPTEPESPTAASDPATVGGGPVPDAPSGPIDCSTVSGEPKSAEECECLGGYIRGDIGDGKVACQEGETTLGRIPLGVEGSVCCKGASSSP